MKKKKRGVRYKASSMIPPRFAAKLDEAEQLIEDGELEEARDILQSLNSRFPNRPEILSPLANVSLDLDDMETYQACCEGILKAIPNDPDAMMGLAGAYLANARPVLAIRAFDRFIERWPTHERTLEAREAVAELEEKVAEMLSEWGIEGEEGFEIAALHEQIQSLMAQRRLSEMRKVAEQLLKIKPDFVPALNNLSLACFSEGRIDEAIAAARRALEINSDNYHALSNLTRYLLLSGHEDEAREVAERLRSVESDDMDVWVKKAEALSFLGDDQGVLEVFHSAQKAGVLNSDYSRNAFFYHVTAVAFARTGEEKQAIRCWEKSLKLDPYFELAEDNLDDLSNSPGKRNGAWAFDFPNWISRNTIEEMYSIASRSKGSKAGSLSQRILKAHPELAHLIPILLDRGDAQAREFAVMTAEMLGAPEMMVALRDFALSRSGSDDVRYMAARIASQAGLLPSGQVRMWAKGEWQDILLIGMELHGETQSGLRGKAERLATEGVMVMNDGDAERAEQLFRKALKIEPDHPSVMNNLAVSLSLQGRTEEARAMVEQIHERHPDYLFARTGMSKFLIEEGKLDEAQEMLDVLLSRKRMHFSEFQSLCDAQINLLVARGDRESARKWLDMWEKIEPDHPAFDLWQEKLGKPRLRFR